MKKYKVKHWKCFWSTYHDTMLAFIDKIENETIGTILMYIILYPTAIIGFPIFLTIAFVWYIKRLKLINKHLKSDLSPQENRAIYSMIKNGYVIELTHQHEDKGE